MGLADYRHYVFFFFFQKEEHIFFLRFWQLTKNTTDFINFVAKKKVKNRIFPVSMEVTSQSFYKYTTKRGY